MSEQEGDECRELADAARRLAKEKPWVRDYALARAEEWEEIARSADNDWTSR